MCTPMPMAKDFIEGAFDGDLPLIPDALKDIELFPSIDIPEPPPTPGAPAETAATSRMNQEALRRNDFASLGMSQLRVPINRNIGGY